MLSFVSFVLVCIGAFNWFTIGLLQYDFVAGLFGSQANVFSRLVYALVGIASIIVIINTIKNRGKFVVSFNKANKEYEDYKEEKETSKRERLATSMESAEDFYKTKDESNNYKEQTHTSSISNHNKDNK